MSGKAPVAERLLRSLWTDMALGMSWTLVPDRLRGIRDAVLVLVHEGNALRRNNERLRRRLQDAEDMNDTLRGMLKDANSANTTAQTMAEHWRLKAQGGNYDATQEEQ